MSRVQTCKYVKYFDFPTRFASLEPRFLLCLSNVLLSIGSLLILAFITFPVAFNPLVNNCHGFDLFCIYLCLCAIACINIIWLLEI